MKEQKIHLIVIALLVALCAQCAWSAWRNSQTTDETYYTASGYAMVRYNNYDFLGEHPPLIMQIGSLPLLLLQPKFNIKAPVLLPNSTAPDISRNGAAFLYQAGNDPRWVLFLQRLPIVLLTLSLGIGIFCLAGELFGVWGALLSLALFVFDPNILAHGSLFTTDMGLAVFYFFSIYALKRFFDIPSDRTALFLGLACGAAFMSKISGLILLPVISFLFLAYYFSNKEKDLLPAPSLSFEKWVLGIALFLIANAVGERQAMVLFGPFCLFAFYLYGRDIQRIRDSKALMSVLKVAALAGAVLCIVYSLRLKKKYGVSLSMFLAAGNLVALGIAVLFARLSSQDARIRLLKFFLAIWVFAALMIVLGYTDIIYKFYRFVGFGNFTRPLGIVLNHSKGGHGVCLEGSFIVCDWRYFPGMIAIKVPLLTLFLAGIGTLGLLLSRRSLLIKMLVFVPAVFFLGAAMANKINIGFRHILPFYPFLFLLAGYAGALVAQIKMPGLKKVFASILVTLVALTAGRTVMAGPDYLAYFNELVGDAEAGAQWVADSNLNWGQDNALLAEFVRNKKIPSIKIVSEAMNADVYDYYKLPWKNLEPKDLNDPMPGFYALGIGYYTGLQKDPQSWFCGKRPDYRVGKTFYVFKVPKLKTLDLRPQTTGETK